MNKTTHELSYSEIRSKMVVDLNDGKNLGHISDMVFSPDLKKVMGIIAPLGKKGMFAKGQDVFIPVSCIKNIGEDVVIVDIGSLCGAPGVPPREEPCRPRDIPQAASGADLGAGEEDPGCDHRCDKCMLFDCRFRWKGKAF
jgi:sporulation protein, ylmC/ymxH family